MAITFPEDIYIRGNLTADSYTFPNNIIGDAAFNGGAPLSAEKQYHQHQRCDGQNHGTAVTAQRRVVHVAHGDGDLVQADFGVVVAAIGGATVTVDILKNGVTALGAPLVISSADAAYAKKTATIAGDGTYVAGNVFEISITVSVGGGTLPQGFFWKLVFREKAGN